MWGSLDELLKLLVQCFLLYYVCLLWLIMLVVQALDYFAVGVIIGIKWLLDACVFQYLFGAVLEYSAEVIFL